MKAPPQIVSNAPETGSGVPGDPRVKHRVPLWVWLFGGGLLAVGLLVLYRFDPVQSTFYPQCAFHSLSGLDCPGCGSMRATYALLHGRFAAAFQLNPLFCLMLPVGAWFALRAILRHLGVDGLPNPFRRPIWSWLLVWVISAFWIVRNIV